MSTPRVLSQPQINMLLVTLEVLAESHTDPKNCFRPVRDLTIVKLFLSTGLRVQELVNLNIEDLDIEEKQLKVRQGKRGNDEYQPIINGKTLEWLNKWLELRKQVNSGDPLFISSRGHRINTDEVRKIVHKACRVAGLPDWISCHTFRHSAATILLRKSSNLVLVQRFLRHRSIATTSIYCNIVKDDVAAGLELAGL